MFHAFLIAVAFATFALPAHAGAWLREEGSGFLSFGSTAFEIDDTRARSQEQSFFIEYGLSPRMTIGASGSAVEGMGGEGHVFLRLPIHNADRPAQLAYEIGFGATSAGVETIPFLKTGLSWGRGVSFGERSGWVNVDGNAYWGLNGANDRFKIDSTFGLGVGDRTQIMAQSFLELGPGEDSHTLMPSLILSNKSGKTRYVVGYEHRTGARASKGLKFGLWQDF